jgi:type VI secretion system protein ImpC
MLPIDRDDFEAVLSAIAPIAALGLPYCEQLPVDTWESMDPDAILGRVPSLASLLAARRASERPDAMRELLRAAGVEIQPPGAPHSGPTPAITARPPALLARGEAPDLLDSILATHDVGVTPEPALPRAASDPELARWVREVALRTEGRTDHAAADRWRDAIDAVLAERLRAILHHPAFQRIEAAWTQVRQLVMRTETGEALRLRVIDVSAEELHDTDAVEQCLARESQIPGGQPVELLIHAHTVAGVREIARLGRLAERAGVPLVAGATVRHFDADLDALPGTQHLGLLWPRVLLRLPYGRETVPITAFPFEEQVTAQTPERYLWGSAAFAVGTSAARAALAHGTPAEAGRFAEIDGLPLHVYRAGGAGAPGVGGPECVGPTEQLLTEPDMKEIAAAGMIPVAAYRGQDRARLGALRALAGGALFDDVRRGAAR